jgi:hypothetical protein
MNIMNSKIALGAGALVIIIAAFFGGYRYASAKSAQAAVTARGQFAQVGMRGGMGRFAGPGAGAVVGQIVSKDDKSITISIPNGGSKIVFLSASTTVSKMTAGSPSDLVVGQSAVVAGTPNSDGSLTASSIDLRPALQTR